jgi:hypothetical protein
MPPASPGLSLRAPSALSRRWLPGLCLLVGLTGCRGDAEEKRQALLEAQRERGRRPAAAARGPRSSDERAMSAALALRDQAPAGTPSWPAGTSKILPVSR